VCVAFSTAANSTGAIFTSVFSIVLNSIILTLRERSCVSLALTNMLNHSVSLMYNAMDLQQRSFCSAMLCIHAILEYRAVSVRPSVRPSRSCILSKRINIGLYLNIFFTIGKPYHSSFPYQILYGNIPTEVSLRGRQMQVG